VDEEKKLHMYLVYASGKFMLTLIGLVVAESYKDAAELFIGAPVDAADRGSFDPAEAEVFWGAHALYHIFRIGAPVVPEGARRGWTLEFTMEGPRERREGAS
jgi:hypothetical protein